MSPPKDKIRCRPARAVRRACSRRPALTQHHQHRLPGGGRLPAGAIVLGHEGGSNAEQKFNGDFAAATRQQDSSDESLTSA